MLQGPLYTAVFKESWYMLWRHKKLLWLGLLATGIGTAGVFEFLMKAYFQLSLQYNSSGASVPVVMLKNIFSFLTNPNIENKLIVGICMLIGLAVGLVAFYFLVIAQGTLVHAAASFTKDKSVNFYEAWATARFFFWPLAAANAVRLVILAGLLVTMHYPLLTFTNPERALMGQLPAFLLIVACLLCALFVIIVGFYVTLYIVIKERGFGHSLHSGVRLFMRHWLVSVEVLAIVALVSLLALLAVIISSVILVVPMILFFYLFAATAFTQFTVSTSMVQITMYFFFACFVAIVLAIMALYTTWVVSAWTSLFLHMHEGNVTSRILHWTRK